MSQAQLALPDRLVIPDIGVNAPVLHIGLTKEGDIGTPKGPDEVSWFSDGTRPGENGSAVISGHYGWKDNRAAAFDNLHKLKRGDMMYVALEDGSVLSFAVRESRIYGANASTQDVFLASDTSHLNLITCTGNWNASKQSYEKRLVVFADRVAGTTTPEKN